MKVLIRAGAKVRKPRTGESVTVSPLELAVLRGQVAAIAKSQAPIEFELDGTIITANENFLAAVWECGSMASRGGSWLRLLAARRREPEVEARSAGLIGAIAEHAAVSAHDGVADRESQPGSR